MQVILYWILGGKNEKIYSFITCFVASIFSAFNSVWAYDKEVNLLMVDNNIK